MFVRYGFRLGSFSPLRLSDNGPRASDALEPMSTRASPPSMLSLHFRKLRHFCHSVEICRFCHKYACGVEILVLSLIGADTQSGVNRTKQIVENRDTLPTRA